MVRRPHRRGPGGEVARGRVHAVPGQQRHGRPEHAGHQEAQLRSAQGLGAGVDRGGEPDGAGGASLGAREERGGAGGAGEGEAGHAQFWLDGRGRAFAPGGRAAEVLHGHADDAHRVQGHGPGDERPARGPDPVHVQRHVAAAREGGGCSRGASGTSWICKNNPKDYNPEDPIEHMHLLDKIMHPKFDAVAASSNKTTLWWEQGDHEVGPDKFILSTENAVPLNSGMLARFVGGTAMTEHRGKYDEVFMRLGLLHEFGPDEYEERVKAELALRGLANIWPIR